MSPDHNPPLNILVVLAAAKVSESRLSYYVDLPDAHVVLVGDEARAAAPNLARFPTWRMPFLGAPERWTAALSWFRGLKSFDPGPIDCVLSFEAFSMSTFQASQLAKRLGVPHIVTIAEVLTRSFFTVPPWQTVGKLISHSANAFVCSVELARTHAVALGCPPDRCVVISPGINVRQFAPAATGRSKDPVLLFVGELRPDKGIRDVLAAVERARLRVPDLRLVVVGDGPLRQEVQAFAGQADYVDYRGKVPRHSLPGLYQEARAFILAPATRTFWAEQFGFASVEAMASGLPVVITDSGAVPDVIPDWNPICPQHDVAALANGIVAALGPAGDEWGERNRTAAQERYDSDTQAVRLRQFLGEQAAAHR